MMIKKFHSFFNSGRKPGQPGNKPDILLIQCPPWDVEMPPLGIAFLSSYLKKHGYKVSLLDLNIAMFNLAKEDIRYLWEQKSYDWWVLDDLFKQAWARVKGLALRCLKNKIKDLDADFIGISVNFAGIKFANGLITMIKKINPRAKIIVGGWGCINSHMRSLYCPGFVDAFVVGEGEVSLLETIAAFRGEKNKSDVAGVYFNDIPGGEYQERSMIMDLDSIPWPTYDGFDLSLYTNRVLPLFTSRGCISRCAFCNDWSTTKPYRYRSADNIFEEIKFHKERNNYEYFCFKDLLCNGNIKELNKLCDLIISSDLNIHWDSQAISRDEMTYPLLCKLKESGCKTLIYGIESFSDNVLKNMGKLFTKDIAERVLRDTCKAGINTYINLIVGFPGETEDDFKDTMEAVKRNKEFITHIGAVSVCLVNAFTDLEKSSFKYRLLLSSDTSIRAKKWRSADGDNTYEIRHRRAEELLGLIKQLGLSFATATI